MERVTVIGAGLAGCEAAWQLHLRGIPVRLVEMRPKKMTPAHVTQSFAELVCSNSLRSNEITNAVGLLKEELRRLGSIIVSCADSNRVAAGSALAVDREGFSLMVSSKIKSATDIEVDIAEAEEIPEGEVIIASGPLTADTLASKISELCSSTELLNFYDAAAPIVTVESIDMKSAYFASRYDKGTADYINCPLTKSEYLLFWKELCDAEQAEIHGFDDRGVFEGCMPVEVLARRGEDTLRYGPLKPVGLFDPNTGKESYAVVQLRRDNAEGTIYNMVGFQTHLKFSEQRRVFSMIPALNNAEFMRFGVMHRNTYLNSPGLLDRYYRLKTNPRICFAGQITGVEGYVESAASGMLAAMELAARLLNKDPYDFPSSTAIGALANYVSAACVGDFQPMNINFGIIDPLDHKVKGKLNKNKEISERSLDIISRHATEETYENYS